MLNQIFNEDCLDTMSRMPDNYVDLVLTSPPYSNNRNYKGYSFNFQAIVKELEFIGIIFISSIGKSESGFSK